MRNEKARIIKNIINIMKAVNKVNIGLRLTKLREEKELSRKELAKKLNISYKVILKYEIDQKLPCPGILVKIANFFNVSVGYIIGETDIRQLADDIIFNEFFKEISSLSDKSKNEIQYVISLYKRKEETSDELTRNKIDKEINKIKIDLEKSVIQVEHKLNSDLLSS